MTRLLKADFHIHTTYSMDCELSLEDIIARCLETEIDCVTIADHGTIEGALKMKELAPFPVIIAEEILTPYGEIMGMFLKEAVPSGLSLEESVSLIKAQDALLALPHPFDPLRGFRLDSKRLEELAEQIDIIEVFNARSPFLWASTKARNFARKHNKPGIAGSDAHTLNEIGSTFVEIPEFNGKDDFLQALKESTISEHMASPLVHFNSTWTKLKKSF